jgi:hypothetical protein
MSGTGRWLAVPVFDWQNFLVYALLLCAVLLIGAVAFALAKRWQRIDTKESLSPSDQLAAYRSLYEQGVMNKEEFERLRALLQAQLREAAAATPATADPETAVARPTGDGAPTPPAPEAGSDQT